MDIFVVHNFLFHYMLFMDKEQPQYNAQGSQHMLYKYISNSSMTFLSFDKTKEVKHTLGEALALG